MRKIIMLLLCLPGVLAATIQGNVYDYALEPLADAVLQINTTPKQQYIAKTGEYEFNVPQGTYMLRASYMEPDATGLYTEELIVAEADGTFNYDLVLFPNLADEEGLSDDLEITVDGFEDRNFTWLYLLLAVLAGIVIYIIYRLNRKEPVDDIYEQVYRLIKDNKRITQKKIRQKVPYSEAKISLVITELESMGKIKKVKKGRGNVIMLK